MSPVDCTSCFLLGDRIMVAIFGRLCVIMNTRNFGIVFRLINYYNELAIVAESLGLRAVSRAEPRNEGRVMRFDRNNGRIRWPQNELFCGRLQNIIYIYSMTGHRTAKPKGTHTRCGKRSGTRYCRSFYISGRGSCSGLLHVMR